MHRDRIAFMRICSGKFERDMEALHSRTGKKVRLSGSHTLFGQNREIVNEGYAGDVLGFVAKADFQLGDTISQDPSFVYHEIPRFAPESFAFLHNPTPGKYKAFRKGIEQLLSENIVQVFHLLNPMLDVSPVLGAIGPLQFEVLQYRLKSEYGAESQLEMKPWQALRWVITDRNSSYLSEQLPHGAQAGRDEYDNLVLLFPSPWSIEHFTAKNPEVKLIDSPSYAAAELSKG